MAKVKIRVARIVIKEKTLEKVSDPDETIEYAVKECSGCQADLSGQESESYETRQVFEVLIKRRVVEHKAEVKGCEKCGSVTTGEIPKEILSQYSMVVV